MASDPGVATVLAFLSEIFARDFSERTLDAWMIVFADWTDEELQRCAQQCAKEPGRKFFPTPGEIAAYRAAPASIDTDRLLDRISKLGKHLASRGWIYPTVDEVRQHFGHDVAIAYIDAGGNRCFAPEDANGQSITRDIARRKFAEVIEAAHRRTPGGLQLPASVPPERQLPPPETERVLLTSREQNPTREQNPVHDTLKAAGVPAPSFPTTTKGRIQVANAYRTAREKAAREWAERHPEEFRAATLAITKAVRAKEITTGLPASPSYAQSRIYDHIADVELAFLPFPDWCKSQGYVLVEPPQYAEATP